MLRSLLALGVWFCAAAPAALLAQEPAALSPEAAPLLRSIRITGNTELSDQAVLDALHLIAGQALSETPDLGFTLADREVEEVGNAVFGRPSETNGLGSLGRLMFRTVCR